MAARNRSTSSEWLLLLSVLALGLMPLIISVVAAMVFAVPPLSLALAAERSPSGTPAAVTVDPLAATDTPYPTPTPIRTATRSPTPSTSPTPTSRTPATRGTATIRPTFTATRTPTATPCPRLQAKLDARGVGDATALTWSWSGGCGAVAGTLTARYLGEAEPYRAYKVLRSPGRQSDSPPQRCEGTFRLLYTLALRDATGQTATPTAQRSITWVC